MNNHNNIRYYDSLRKIARHEMPGTSDHGEFFFDVLGIAQAVHTLQQRFFSGEGVSAGRFAVMVMLGLEEGVVRRPAELAAAVGVTRPTITGVLDALEKEGFLKRELDSHDRRSFRVESTPLGRNALRYLMQGYFTTVLKFSERFSTDERSALRELALKLSASSALPEEVPVCEIVAPQEAEPAVEAPAPALAAPPIAAPTIAAA